MSELSMVVTPAVLAHISQGNENQSQIALRSPSPNIASELSQIRAHNRKILLIGGCIKLIVGDTGAIWRAHNDQFVDDFDTLFTLLARRPGSEMRFLCEFTQNRSCRALS